MVLRIRLQSYQVHFTCYSILQHNKHKVYTYTKHTTYTYTNESKHGEMGPVRQNPIQRPSFRSVRVRATVHCIVHVQLLHTTLHRTNQIFCPLTVHADSHHCSDDVYLREGGGSQSVRQRCLLAQLWLGAPYVGMSLRVNK